ncbi:uncharacterized protein MONOS_14119 [Monocercomonoides exilis]|uniref:uncharacterized protein n=1 Tax=Monocercomonoides exilis TaxID=2049356 RepID=UPI00355958BA|nr:hypothetical protein MONOS_14119 [Monocercomonoides exilis]|eukprot:MONOS_14119.1-p1 / transcript=MONOS_14119.1 / gene=MONOS_14119 / organism=Monocercomonoides_exilis_PA203 / gene_product=unspecified product / transcript_product=unspecified product / location=Mono_scaffold00941:18804-20273(-) / protein_length=470 / sequence_SO=supercontig / SO=protein_coding / is_pseudo=false
MQLSLPQLPCICLSPSSPPQTTSSPLTTHQRHQATGQSNPLLCITADGEQSRQDSQAARYVHHKQQPAAILAVQQCWLDAQRALHSKDQRGIQRSPIVSDADDDGRKHHQQWTTEGDDFFGAEEAGCESSALDYSHSASSSSVLLAPIMPTSPSSSSSTTSSSSSSTGAASSRSTSMAKLTNTLSDNTSSLLNSFSTLSVHYVRVATFVMHPSTSTKPPSSSSEENNTSGISLRPIPTTTQLSPYSSSSFANHYAVNTYHHTYLLPLHPPLVDFGRPFVIEQFTSFATPRQQVTVKESLERCEQSMETRITAMHQQSHVFSMARRCVFRMASAASSDGRVASVGISAAAVVSLVSVLIEILEGVPVDGMNVANGSALKACSSASPQISKAAFNSDEDEDIDTLLEDKVFSNDGRLSVPERSHSSLSPSPPPPQQHSLSSSVNQLALQLSNPSNFSVTNLVSCTNEKLFL